jgi:predicted esterase
MKAWLSLLMLFGLLVPYDDSPVFTPQQPLEGPGSSCYAHQEVRTHDFSMTPQGFWIFEPAEPTLDSARVIVFLHGYSATNPFVYGGWIRHLVRKGHIVIYPRYQKNLVSPSSKAYVENAAIAIRQALSFLEENGSTCPIVEPLIMVGHSYGGVIAANLSIHYADWGLPPPKGLLISCPGTGPMRGAWLPSYEGMSEGLYLLVIVGSQDQVVGEKVGQQIFETAIHTSSRNFVRMLPDGHGLPKSTAGHNEPHALDAAFDNGRHGLSYHRGLKYGKYDAADYFAYWKLLDALSDCLHDSLHCNVAFGNTPEQRYMGTWSDGVSVRELEVILPPPPAKKA